MEAAESAQFTGGKHREHKSLLYLLLWVVLWFGVLRSWGSCPVILTNLEQSSRPLMFIFCMQMMEWFNLSDSEQQQTLNNLQLMLMDAPSPSLKLYLSKSNPKLNQTTERETSGIETNRPALWEKEIKNYPCYNMCCFFFLHNNHLCAYVCMYVYIVCVCVSVVRDVWCGH